MAKYAVSGFEIRPVERKDCWRLLYYRNDTETRRQSRNRGFVQWPDHIRWFNARMSRSDPAMYWFSMKRMEGWSDAGFFRLDDDEISYYIIKQWRGRGLATDMLTMANERFGPLRAEIYEKNYGSIKAAERAGLKITLLHRD